MNSYPVMTRPDWQGVFTRTVRTPAGEGAERVEKMQFEHRQAVEVSKDVLTFLMPDVGKALVVAKFDDKGRPKPDWDKTARLKDGEPIDSVFADAPPIVDVGEEIDPIPIEESLIPPKHFAVLKKANLHTLEGIEIYLSEHDDLTGVDGIGKAANTEIMEALEAHAEPA